VFGHVGKAWDLLTGSLEQLRDYADRFASEVVVLAGWAIHVAIPGLFRQALGWYHDALNFARTVWADAQRAINRAILLAADAAHQLRVYVDDHVLAPLSALIRLLRADLVKWGYFAYQLLTHPATLAGILIRPLVQAAIAVFDDIALPAGEFALRLVAKNPRRWLGLIETILKAVL
jgi:hypothetical protein